MRWRMRIRSCWRRIAQLSGEGALDFTAAWRGGGRIVGRCLVSRRHAFWVSSSLSHCT